MQLVILAAGQGTRLGALAQNAPKSLVTVLKNKTYLGLQLKAFNQFPFSKKIIVAGYGKDKLESYLKDSGFDDYTVVSNLDYKKGNLLSVMSVANHLEPDDFCLFNADHFYDDSTYTKIFDQTPVEFTVCADQDRDLAADDMKLMAGAGKVSKMHKKLTEFQWGYVGVTMVPKALASLYWKTCHETLAAKGESVNCEEVVNSLVAKDQRVNILDVSGSWWTEIDTPEDLTKAQNILSELYHP